MKRLSSIFYMWMSFAIGLIAVLMMFVPMAVYDGGFVVSARSLFFGDGYNGGAWLAFLGYMLILLASIGVAILALPVITPSAKVEKIVLISASALVLLGAIFVALIQVNYKANGGVYQNFEHFHVGYYLTLLFSLGCIGLNTYAMILDW